VVLSTVPLDGRLRAQAGGGVARNRRERGCGRQTRRPVARARAEVLCRTATCSAIAPEEDERWQGVEDGQDEPMCVRVEPVS
jgi:hypothetical protein